MLHRVRNGLGYKWTRWTTLGLTCTPKGDERRRCERVGRAGSSSDVNAIPPLCLESNVDSVLLRDPQLGSERAHVTAKPLDLLSVPLDRRKTAVEWEGC